MKSIKIFTIVLLTVLMASCAGMGSGVKEDDVLDVIEMINGGKTELLVEQSKLPFVFDSEILESETQINMLWTGLVKSGFALDNPEIIQQRPLDADDAALFSDSWEIKTYFKNLLSVEDSFIEIKSASFKVYMVLSHGKSGTRIKAWKGELR